MLGKIFVDEDFLAIVAAQFVSFTDHCILHIVSVEPYNDHMMSISCRCLFAKPVTSHNVIQCDRGGVTAILLLIMTNTLAVVSSPSPIPVSGITWNLRLLRRVLFHTIALEL